jgi:dihydroorotate dehydrogenase
MPDWTYQPVFRPLLRLLAPKAGRLLILGGLGLIARSPGGCWLIEGLGHMRPPGDLAFEKRGRRFPSRVGIGCLVDGQLLSPEALVRLGIGALEVGPIGTAPFSVPELVQIDRAAERITIHHAGVRRSQAEILKRLTAASRVGVPLFVRLAGSHETAVDIGGQAGLQETSLADAFVLPADLNRFNKEAITMAVRSLLSLAGDPLVLVAVSYDAIEQPAGRTIARWAADDAISGVLIEPLAPEPGALQSAAADLQPVLAALPKWREACGDSALLVARGGLHEPIDGLRAVRAGADLILLDSGLVHCGPGLPKRINELILADERQRRPDTAQAECRERSPNRPSAVPDSRPAAQSWLWLMLLGLGLLIGGGMTLAVALSRVVLPYDEALTGLTRLQLMAINPRLLDFMRHDRITLSGTMLAVGILYLALTVFGVRRGLHWAWLTVVISAAAGYLSFFLFLGFGYFDPFHAFVTAVSFPLLLLGIHAPLGGREQPLTPDLHNDWRWRLGLWGQLLFVIHGVMLIAAGFTISYIGATCVFVAEDMQFLCTADGVLQAAHPQLVPLVAHDRASFGGMLVTCGLATLLPAMWGFHRGRAWLWAALVGAGAVAYVATIAVHLAVGYTSNWHLLPAYFGFAALGIGGGLTYPYLCDRSSWARASITC